MAAPAEAKSSDPLESRLLRIESLLESQAASMERLEFAVTGFSPSAAPADENGLHGDSSPKKTRKVPPLAVGRTAAVRAVAA